MVQKQTRRRSSLIMGATLGLVLGAVAGLLVFVMPIRMLESVTMLTGLAKLMVQAEPPISPNDRSLLALLAGTGTAAIGWVLVDWLLFGRVAMRTLFQAREDEFEDWDAEGSRAADPLDLMAFDPRPPFSIRADSGDPPVSASPLQPGVPPPLVPAADVVTGEPVREMPEAQPSNKAQPSNEGPAFEVSGLTPEPVPERSIMAPEPAAPPSPAPESEPRPAQASTVGVPFELPPLLANRLAPSPGSDKAKLEDLLARFERGVQNRRDAAARALPAPSPSADVPTPEIAAPTDSIRTISPASQPEPVPSAPDAARRRNDELLDQPLHLTLDLLRNMVKR